MLQSWIFGSFAVYAQNPYAAREAYELVRNEASHTKPCGTVLLDTGEKVDWINIRHPAPKPLPG
jgi:hypothetical protein